jgi:acetylornithine/succinyldiaminopimelate/putrescine aminotransferase
MTLPQPIAADVVVWCREHGLLLNSPAPSVLRFLPALNVQRSEIKAMATILIAALRVLLPQKHDEKITAFE